MIKNVKGHMQKCVNPFRLFFVIFFKKMITKAQT